MKERHLSWEKIHADSRSMAEKIKKEKRQIQGIIAVARGGLVPSAIIAHALGVPVIEAVGMASYDADRAQSCVKKVSGGTVSGDGAGWLIIDDLVDSGRTFAALRASYPNALYCALYAKPEGKQTTDLCAVDVAQREWLVFPWEC